MRTGHAEAPAFLKVLSGETQARPPLWMMRQAGRYLPEYRALRKQAKGFLDFCYTPEMAIEATLQPIRRFGLDAAILFSDILVVPDALGQPVRFVEGEGPRLDPIDLAALDRLDIDAVVPRLAPVYETVRGVRAALPRETAFIGFCGAPWTVATYMIAGQGTPAQAPARLATFTDPERFARLVDILVEASARHLIAQIDAGVQAVQIFDSWAGTLDDLGFARWSVTPVRAIVDRVKAAHPGIPVIGFPRGAGERAVAFLEGTRVDAIGLDWGADPGTIRRCQARAAVQGNLDPLRLVAGGQALDEGIDRMVETFSGGPWIANLGHGIEQVTPIAHVERLIARLRGA